MTPTAPLRGRAYSQFVGWCVGLLRLLTRAHGTSPRMRTGRSFVCLRTRWYGIGWWRHPVGARGLPCDVDPWVRTWESTGTCGRGRGITWACVCVGVCGRVWACVGDLASFLRSSTGVCAGSCGRAWAWACVRGAAGAWGDRRAQTRAKVGLYGLPSRRRAQGTFGHLRPGDAALEIAAQSSRASAHKAFFVHLTCLHRVPSPPP